MNKIRCKPGDLAVVIDARYKCNLGVIVQVIELHHGFGDLRYVSKVAGHCLRCLSLVYQHAETEIMDFITAEIEKLGNTVLARIHDAIIVKYRLGESKHEIELLLQSKYENKYWHLTMKELKAYERPYCLDKAAIDAHREKIAEEERIAKFVSKTQVMNYSWSVRSNSDEIHGAVDA